MQSICELILEKDGLGKVRISQRCSIIAEIYSVYDTDQEVKLRKIANWKRYVAFLKEKKVRASKVQEGMFKKSRKFLKKLSPKEIAIRLSHLKEKDLYWMLSVSKDTAHRGKSVGSFLLGSVRLKQ